MIKAQENKRELDTNNLGIGWYPPYSNDKDLLRARVNFFKNFENKTIKYITSEYINFIEGFEKSLHKSQNISISGLEAFKQKDVITGCQHFIDQLIMTHGLNNLQVFKGGYNYYKRLDKNFRYVDVDTLEAGKPLVLEYPFPGTGTEHPDFQKIVEKSNSLGIDIYLDCAWLPLSWGLNLDVNEPCIKGIAMSLSKCFGLHWSRIGVRWMKEKTEDTISIENKFRMVSFPNIMVGKYYLDCFPIDFLIEKYKDKYFDKCKELDLMPTKNIINAYSKKKQSMVGIANAILKND